MEQTNGFTAMRSAAPPIQPPGRRPAGQSIVRADDEIRVANIKPGIGDTHAFAMLQRMAMAFASSTIIPLQYRASVPAKGMAGRKGELVENRSGIANCIVAIQMAGRMGIDPITVMQNLNIIEGRPSWSSVFIAARIAASGIYAHGQPGDRDYVDGTLQYDITEGEPKPYQWTEVVWDNGERREVKKTVTAPAMRCVAYVKRPDGSRLEGPAVTMEMAVAEGWYGRNGSKWQTMPQVMIRYRAAAFFGRVNCPHLFMGLQSVEEVVDVLEAQRNEEGAWEVTTEAGAPATEQKPEEEVRKAPEAEEEKPPVVQITQDQTPAVDIGMRSAAAELMAKMAGAPPPEHHEAVLDFGRAKRATQAQAAAAPAGSDALDEDESGFGGGE